MRSRYARIIFTFLPILCKSLTGRSNHGLERTRPSRLGCNSCVIWAGSLTPTDGVCAQLPCAPRHCIYHCPGIRRFGFVAEERDDFVRTVNHAGVVKCFKAGGWWTFGEIVSGNMDAAGVTRRWIGRVGGGGAARGQENQREQGEIVERSFHSLGVENLFTCCNILVTLVSHHDVPHPAERVTGLCITFWFVCSGRFLL